MHRTQGILWKYAVRGEQCGAWCHVQRRELFGIQMNPVRALFMFNFRRHIPGMFTQTLLSLKHLLTRLIAKAFPHFIRSEQNVIHGRKTPYATWPVDTAHAFLC